MLDTVHNEFVQDYCDRYEGLQSDVVIIGFDNYFYLLLGSLTRNDLVDRALK